MDLVGNTCYSANLAKSLFATISFAAHLHSGELVAVKVQRPGMSYLLTLDALLFHMIGGQLKRFAKARKDLLGAVNEMVRLLNMLFIWSQLTITCNYAWNNPFVGYNLARLHLDINRRSNFLQTAFWCTLFLCTQIASLRYYIDFDFDDIRITSMIVQCKLLFC